MGYNRRNRNEARREQRRADVRMVRDRTYGIALEALIAAQDGKCGICETTTPKRFTLDHDHVTGQVRGALCSPCNSAIGLLGDTVEAVGRALQYLMKQALTKRCR